MLKLDRVMSAALPLEATEASLANCRQALEHAKNWKQKIAIVNCLINGWQTQAEYRLKVKHRMLFELLPRVSQVERNYLDAVYTERSAFIVEALETGDSWNIHDAATEYTNHQESTFEITYIVRNIQTKAAVFKIYERYNFQILHNMLNAAAQGVLYEFLSAFNEFNFNEETVDAEMLESFILKLSTF